MIRMIDKNTGKTGVGKNGEGIPIEEVKPHVLEQIYRDDTGVNEYLSKSERYMQNMISRISKRLRRIGLLEKSDS